MSAEAARRSRMLSLGEVVDRYLSVAQFGKPIALSAFRLSREETQILFSSLDEDYHINRFLRFSNVEGNSYIVSGSVVTHVSIDEGIQSLL